MLEVVKLFEDSSTVDELGIGSVRDTFSNAFFPGTSTLHTRAKYFLFVAWLVNNAWLVNDVARHRWPVERAPAELRSHEVELIHAVIAGDETLSVIGRDANTAIPPLNGAATDKIRSVFSIHMTEGPDGKDKFGYSDGLLEVLGHELLVWARPTDGTDPGLDFAGGRPRVQRMCRKVANAVQDGHFTSGAPIVFELHNGSMVLTVGEPQTAYVLEASALAPHTPVAPVRWELRRNDFGPLLPVDHAELPGLIDKCRQLAKALPPTATVPPELKLDVDRLDMEDFTVSGEFGPATPLVRAVAASIATASKAVIGGLDLNAEMLHLANDGQHMYELGLAKIGRGAGRSAALSRCDELAARLLGKVPSDKNLDRLSDSVRVTLKTAALHDLLTESGRRRGYGPWETTLYFPERPPGLTAPEHVVAAVEATLRAVPPVDVAALIDRCAGGSPSEDLDIYGITHPTGLPPGHPLQQHWEDRTGRLADDVRQTLTMLLSATAWRRQEGESDNDLSAYVAWSVVDEYADLLPSLRELLLIGERPEDH